MHEIHGKVDEILWRPCDLNSLNACFFFLLIHKGDDNFHEIHHVHTTKTIENHSLLGGSSQDLEVVRITPIFICHKKAIWKGSHTPIPRGQQRSPMVINHLQYKSWDDPPSVFTFFFHHHSPELL